MDWKPEYAFGIRKIDHEHEEMLRHISNIESAVEMKIEWRMLHFVILQLLRVTKEHFNSEEVMMRAHGYDETENHAKAHRYFINKLEEFEHYTINELEGRQKMVKYLREWFTKHLFGHDKQYAEFVACETQ